MIGQTISHYIILEHLGGGGMGVVYKAEDTRLRRTVALKFLPPELTRDPEAKERFVHEAQAASALQHNNICAVHDIDQTDDGQMFIVMDFYEGETLKKKIGRGPLKIEDALDIAIQIAQGLTKAHEHGIVHRDIKPANVMITSDGVAKIVDFGLAKLSGRTMLTKTGSTLGTAAYMSPEQARGEPADHRSDIWSVGVTLFEMLTGKRPFDAEYENALLYSILNTQAEPITGLRTGIPLNLEEIVRKCMSKDRGDRYQHTDDLLVDLRSVRHTLEAQLSPTRPFGSHLRKSQATIAAIAFAGIAVVGVIAYLLTRTPGDISAGTREKSIGVIPFTPMGRTFEDTMFTDGVHDEILTQLSKIGNMRVIGRNTMVLFRNSGKRLRDIGDELEVNYLLEGSIQRFGNRFRFNVQLIRVRDEGHEWAETYEQSESDLFAVQSDVAQRIATSLRAVLTPTEKARIDAPLTANMEAHDLYLKGTYYWQNYYDSSGNDKAAELFEMAAEKDPQFAQALAWAATVHAMMYTFFDSSPKRLEKARKMLARAAELSPDDADLHLARGQVSLLVDRDPDRALAEFLRALELRPGQTALLIHVAEAYAAKRELHLAREYVQRAWTADPLQLTGGLSPYRFSQYFREWERARSEIDQYLAKHPDDPVAYRDRASILVHGFGDLKGAHATLQEGMRQQINQFRGWKIRPEHTDEVEYYAHNYDTLFSILQIITRVRNLYDAQSIMRKGHALVALGRWNTAHACYDSVRSWAENDLRNQPNLGSRAWAHFLLGMAQAGLQRDNPYDHIDSAFALYTKELDYALNNREEYFELGRAQAMVMMGELERAIDEIDRLLGKPGFLTAWALRFDPVYDPLRGNSRFSLLLAKHAEH